jgi:hypothetical protein
MASCSCWASICQSRRSRDGFGERPESLPLLSRTAFVVKDVTRESLFIHRSTRCSKKTGLRLVLTSHRSRLCRLSHTPVRAVTSTKAGQEQTESDSDRIRTHGRCLMLKGDMKWRTLKQEQSY